MSFPIVARQVINMRLKLILAILFSTLLPLVAVHAQARASWFIDPKKFHASVHGQKSCQDCHEEVAKRNLHPNPAEVSKKSLDFFEADHCLVCHGDTQDKLRQSIHGSKKIENPKAYDQCLSCHDPHEQVPVGEKTDRFDSSKPRQEQCGACHEERKTLPPFSQEDEACMACHRLVSYEDEGRMRRICFHCHAQEGTDAQKLTAVKVALIIPENYEFTPHAGVACTVCHTCAAEFNHDQQEPGDCRQCHLPHDEKVAHDLHGLVACEACHLGGIQPVRDPVSRCVIWKRVHESDEPSRIHDMFVKADDRSCQKCHRPGNEIGAAAMVLPSKSILCMPCHAATFSVEDTTTIISLVIFFIGLVMVLSYVLSGSTAEGEDHGVPEKCIRIVGKACSAIFSGKMLLVAKVFFTDVLLQGRLYRQSRSRWFVHSLVFYPFLLRFLWGMVALIGSLCKPQWPFVWAMLDKNQPVTAFLFDLTGIMVILGTVFALLRGAKRRRAQPPDLPNQDRIALILIGGIAVVGFVLEGMRIAMTGFPGGAEWAFLGYTISSLFGQGGYLVNFYGYVWYLHALLVGAFIAYIPFSRLLHIIFGPLVLAGNAARERNHRGA
jgi:nitrate reductase gamma subunit